MTEPEILADAAAALVIVAVLESIAVTGEVVV